MTARIALFLTLLVSLTGCGDINGYICKQMQSKEAECRR
jgi:hypothetical protein